MNDPDRNSESLAESHARLAAIVDSATDAIITIDGEQLVRVFNGAAERMFGYTAAEAMGQRVEKFLPERFREGHSSSVRKFGESDIEMGMMAEGRTTYGWRANGEEFPVEATISHSEVRGLQFMTAIIRDISHRIRTDRQIQLQAAALESAANAIVITDREGLIISVNAAFTRLTGYSADEAIGQNPRILKSGKHVDSFYKKMWETVLAGEVWDGELVNRRKDGSTFVEEQIITPVLNDDGEITNFIAIKQDVTERRRVEQELAGSRKRYRDLVENAIDIIYTHDIEGNYTSANRAVEDILGYTVEEALTKNLADTVAPDFIEKAKQMSADLIAGKKVPVTELEIIAKDGRHVLVEVNAKLMIEDGVPVGIQGVARDITARNQLELQFLQAQKMEGIGLLAGGIAHDFNNLLTAINGYSDLTLRKMAADDPLRKNLEQVKDAGVRAAALTAQLLAFSRKQVLKPTVHNVNTVIENLERMLRRIIRENIELRTVLDPSLGNVRADPVQIEQVIMNLAVNARDAMTESGTLTIETQNVYLDEEYVSQHLASTTGRFVKITVADTGSGMDEITRQHIFEPFFTTKEVGKGTGLGLSTVFGIVKQSGGDITVYSEVGHGTVFKIYLPCVDENIEKSMWVDEDDEDLSGSETILLVEDEEVVRNLVREILANRGYKVLEAKSGKAALEIFESYPDKIHLMLTDVIMPKMSGGELRDKAIVLRPNIKVVFMSGYTDESISDSGILKSGAAFIEKPFSPDSLARKIRHVLQN